MVDDEIKELIPVPTCEDIGYGVSRSKLTVHYRGTVPGNRLNSVYDFDKIHHIDPYKPYRTRLDLRHKKAVKEVA